MPLLRSFLIAILISPWLLNVAGLSVAQQKSASSPWQRPEGSKALLESLGIQFDELKDGAPTSDSELELYLKILSRLGQLPRSLVDEMAERRPETQRIPWEESLSRGELLRVVGSTVAVKTIELPPSLAERFETKSLRRFSIMSESKSGQPSPDLEIWTNQDASFWPAEASISVVVHANAVFLRKGEPSPSTNLAPAVCVATHVACFPTRPGQFADVIPSRLTLCGAGFDYSYFATIQKENSKRLTPEVTEPFLQMLAAQPRIDGNVLETQPLELGKLVADPAPLIGEAMEFEAIARRVIAISIENESDRKRLGIDRYYEIDLVYPKSVRTLVNDKAGKQHEVVQENFPLTLCAISPPQGLPLEEDIRQQIRAKAFFFKLWAYESKFAQAQGAEVMQVSPLFIANEVEIAAPPKMSSESLIWVIGGALVLLASISIWGYLLLRSDDDRERRLKRDVKANLPTKMLDS